MQNKTQHNARLATLASSVALTAALIVAGCGGGGGGLVVPTPSPTVMPTPVNAGKIVFTSSRSNQSGVLGGIFTMNPDGSNVTRVVPGGIQPAWSPDRKKIALAGGGIYVANADGTGLTQLTQATLDDHPAWSPDGTRITFASKRDGQYELYVMQADGTRQRRLLAKPDTDEANPAWSPDGTQIAFESRNIPRDGRSAGTDAGSRQHLRGGGQIVFPTLFVMNSDGSNVRQLGGEFTDNPAWRPNSRSLIYETRTGLATIDADGQNQKPLVEGYFDPVYSPDGSKIACVGNTASGNSEIFVLNADGTNPVNITNNPARDVTPDWR